MISTQLNRDKAGSSLPRTDEAGEIEVDVAIVGGGLAGLAAAAYLARGGRSVAVFERSEHIGGRAITQDYNGFMFNMGAHALYDKSPAAEVLRELGVEYTGGSPVGIRCVSRGDFYLAPLDTASLLRTSLLSAAAKWKLSRLLLKLQRADPKSPGGITLRGWLQREARHPDVRRIMEASARLATYTNAPTQLSFGLFVDVVQQVSRGKVVYVDGGWQTIVDGLARAAKDAGARIFTGARVEAMEQSEGRATGVRLADGTIFKSTAVLMATSPRETLKLLPEGRNADLGNWVENTQPARVACLDVALRRLPQPENRVVFDVDRPLFLTVQSEFSKVAPRGAALLYAVKYLDPVALQDAEADRRELEAWLDQTQRGWREEVVECRYLPHMVVNNALVTASQGGLAGRPGTQVEGIRDLYIAGDWVGPTGSLAAASLASAKLAAEAILASSVETRSRAA